MPIMGQYIAYKRGLDKPGQRSYECTFTNVFQSDNIMVTKSCIFHSLYYTRTLTITNQNFNLKSINSIKTNRRS